MIKPIIKQIVAQVVNGKNCLSVAWADPWLKADGSLADSTAPNEGYIPNTGMKHTFTQCSYIINGKGYGDGNVAGATLSRYRGVTGGTHNGAALEFAVIGDTNPAGKSFKVVVRGYTGDTDTVGVDSDPVTYTVPAGFIPAAPTAVKRNKK